MHQVGKLNGLSDDVLLLEVRRQSRGPVLHVKEVGESRAQTGSRMVFMPGLKERLLRENEADYFEDRDRTRRAYGEFQLALQRFELRVLERLQLLVVAPRVEEVPCAVQRHVWEVPPGLGPTHIFWSVWNPVSSFRCSHLARLRCVFQ